MRKFGAARIATSLAILACGLIACESFGGEIRDPAPFEPIEQDASSATDAGPSDAAPDPETSTSEEPGPMTCEEAGKLVPSATTPTVHMTMIDPVDIYAEEIENVLDAGGVSSRTLRIVLTEQPNECAVRRGIAARHSLKERSFEIRRTADKPIGIGTYVNSPDDPDIRVSISQRIGDRCMDGGLLPEAVSGSIPQGHIAIRNRDETHVEGTILLTSGDETINMEFNAPICHASAHVPALCCE